MHLFQLQGISWNTYQEWCMSVTRRFLIPFLVLALASRGSLASQTADPAPRWAYEDSTWDVSFTITKRKIEIRFPEMPLALIGCPYPDSLRGVPERGYQWQVTNQFSADSSARGTSHFMFAGAYFRLPTSLELTAERLDSALAAAEITVDEAGGEPPMRINSMTPARASLRRVAGRVVLSIEDPAAVRAFRRTGGSQASIFWCQRDIRMNFAYRPITP